MSLKRVVITGTGAITPIGLDTESFWNSLVAGRHGIAPIDSFDTSNYKGSLAAAVKGFDPLEHIERKEARRMDRYTQFAMVAAAEAMNESGLEITDENCFDVGVIIGSGIGGIETFQSEVTKLNEKGPRSVSPLFIPMMISNMAAGRVSMAYGAKGANFAITTACSSGAHAIGEAFRKIKYGELTACIAGGAEATITEVALAGFGNMTALSTATDPDRASIPFDKERDGFIMGEGAGILILEEYEHAKARGAKIIAEVAGYGATGDAYHITSPDPNGSGAIRAMQQATKEAGVSPETIDYINAHGTSTPINDAMETKAIHSFMGSSEKRPLVSSTKSMTGHLLGAAGAIEAIVLAYACKNNLVPPTVGLKHADPDCDLDYVSEGARAHTVHYALSNSLGFGGHNSCLCIKKFED